MQFVTQSVDDTLAIAERMGSALHGGEVIKLVSDLGGGKTTFTRGLAKGLGVEGAIASPTFTVSREYEGRLRLYHFDFYRLHEAGIMSEEFREATQDPKGVVVVEWADVVRDALPESPILITITAKSEQSRAFTVEYPDALYYVVEAMA